MAWPNGTRLKTFAAAGSYLPADANNVEDRMLQVAGHRGKSNIATEEARTNVAYGLLTTPDRVSSVVLPADGLICVAFQGMWKESVNGAARAAIFVGANQLKSYEDNAAAPTVREVGCYGGADSYAPLASYSMGLLPDATGATAYTGDVTTGQLVGYGGSLGGSTVSFGGPCYIFAAAGTYDVSVQFKASSGSVTAKNRKLWVWTLTFD